MTKRDKGKSARESDGMLRHFYSAVLIYTIDGERNDQEGKNGVPNEDASFRQLSCTCAGAKAFRQAESVNRSCNAGVWKG